MRKLFLFCRPHTLVHLPEEAPYKPDHSGDVGKFFHLLSRIIAGHALYSLRMLTHHLGPWLP